MWSSFFALWFGLLCLQRLSLGKHRPSDLSWVNFGAVGATGLSSPWNKHSIVGTVRHDTAVFEASQHVFLHLIEEVVCLNVRYYHESLFQVHVTNRSSGRWRKAGDRLKCLSDGVAVQHVAISEDSNKGNNAVDRGSSSPVIHI